MSIVHADNFSLYGTDESHLTEGVYAQVATAGTTTNLTTDPDGVSGGYVLQCGVSSSDTGIRFILPAATTTVGLAARLYMAALPTVATVSGRSPVMQVRDGSNNILYRLWVTTTGAMTVSNAAGTTLYSTTGPVLAAGSWFHIEFKTVINASTGSFEVRVEGTTVITSGATNTGSTSIAQVWLGISGGGTGAQIAYWKDFVVWNGLGSSNNDFLGSVLVTTLAPTSDASLNWTPSSGATGYDILDNIPPVDASYISAPTPAPSPYVAVLSDLPTTTTSVKALVTYVRATKSDGGDGSLQVGVISDPLGTPATGLGTDRPITTSQAYWKDVFELDPKTGAAWLVPAANLARLQLNRTT
jgi:hypothetical protein